MADPSPHAEATLRVNVSAEESGEVPTDLLRRGVSAALRREDVVEAEISVAVVGDQVMRDLNRRYLGHEGTTDVIAFPLSEPNEPVVGDVYVGLDQARRQADALGVPLHEELTRLAIHGILHVLGHEHPDGNDRTESPMYRIQEELVDRTLGRRRADSQGPSEGGEVEGQEAPRE